MAEYRVTALHYRFATDGSADTFDSAATRSGTLGDWTYTLEAGLLRAVPAADYRDRRKARDDLEPYLRDWE